MLIAHGHTVEAIRGYTIGQAREFIGAIERMNAQRRIGEAITARMAQADGKAWRGYIRRLEGAQDGR